MFQLKIKKLFLIILLIYLAGNLVDLSNLGSGWVLDGTFLLDHPIKFLNHVTFLYIYTYIYIYIYIEIIALPFLLRRDIEQWMLFRTEIY